MGGSRVRSGRAAEDGFRRAGRAGVGGICGWMRGMLRLRIRVGELRKKASRLLVLVVDARKQVYDSSRRE